MDRWELGRQTTNGFAMTLRKEIADFPLPEKPAIKSLVVYTQEITTNAVVDRVGFWTTPDTRYEDAIRAYAKAHGVGLEVNGHPEMKEMCIRGGLRTTINQSTK